MTAYDGKEYAWNGENRLVPVTPLIPAEGDQKVAFVYDYLGRRVKKAVYAYGSGGWQVQKEILFVYDGWNLIQEKEVSGTGDPLFDKFYVWGLDLSQTIQGAGGVGGLLVMVDIDGDTYHYCFDGIGNVCQLVNTASGEIAAHYEFDPFGKVVQKSGGIADDNPFMYSTKYFDNDLEHYSYIYRYYSPNIGRWLTRDPFSELGFINLRWFADIEGEDGINLYAFLFNAPTDQYDALGLAAETPWDAFNVGVGVLSLGCSVATGNVIGAVVDVVGLGWDLAATAVPFVPGGASVGIKTYRLAKASRGLALAMQNVARGAKGPKKLIRYVLTEVDQAHHIIPHKGANAKWLKGRLQKDMDRLRAKAKKLGIDIHGAENGVSLNNVWHRNNTLKPVYYQRVIRYFERVNSKEEFLKRLDDLADALLRESGKLK